MFVESNNLKLDGFEFAKEIDPITKTVSIKDSEKHGMFNCPELFKYNKINNKYHIWYNFEFFRNFLYKMHEVPYSRA